MDLHTRGILGCLSPRQEICLFYLMRGKTMKCIAEILDISPKTVETHIQVIKSKLNCYSKSQLIEKAFSDGFYDYLLSKITHQEKTSCQ